MLSACVFSGILYGVEMMVLLPFHLTVLTILVREKEFRNKSAYRIMIHMSICECLQTIGYILASIMSIAQTLMHPYVPTIGGAFLSATWIGIVLFIFLLTLNRFMVFANLSAAKPTENRFISRSIFLIWTICAVIFGAHLTPQLTMVYIVEKNTYWFGNKLSVLVGTAESYFICGTLLVTFVVCVATVITIIIKRNLFTTQFKVSIVEIKLFLQTLFIFSYLTAIRCMWLFGESLLTTEASYIVLAFATQAIGGLNPLLYLLFNKGIRRHFKRYMGFSTSTVFVQVVDKRSKQTCRSIQQ
uniref:7TM_GPCR_Srx domain-containing protein n=1 Tax=Steinernema glaseri TaxID=37863 RepID=A0A1I7Z9M0_9BILA